MKRYCLTVKEAAAAMGISKWSVYRAVEKGDLRSERINGVILIPARALVERFGEPIDMEAA